MSNKLKGFTSHPNNIEKDCYGNRRQRALVREARKQGYRHPGSKRFDTLIQIIPSKIASQALRSMLSRIKLR